METTQRLDFAAYTDSLRALLFTNLITDDHPVSISSLQQDPIWQETTLTHVLYALNAHLQGVEFPEMHIEQTEAGALSLFKRAGHLWQGFVCPVWHAECGGYLALLAKWRGDKALLEKAKKMATWHLMTLDHRGLPIFSLHGQEGSGDFTALVLANAFLFAALSATEPEFASTEFRLRTVLANGEKPTSTLAKLLEHLFPFPEEKDSSLPLSIFCDKQLNLALCRTATTTVLSTLSGCKSSLGAFLHRDAAILSYGPQVGALGESSHFGIAGRARFAEMSVNEKEETYRIAAKTHMTAPSEKTTKFSPMQESGFSGLFCECEQTYRDQSLDLSTRIFTIDGFATAHFVFFAKAKRCRVGKLHQLNPCSFDRYKGPTEKVYVVGEEGSILIEPKSSFRQMEVIPLSGEGCFWGSDFLIAFEIDKEALYRWSLGVEHEI